MTIDVAWLDSHKWGIRSSEDGVSRDHFVWPPVGEWTEAPDWNSRPVCGGGLHCETPQHHGYRMDYSRIDLIEYEGEAVGIDGDKCKVRRARIVAIGADIPREAFERCGYLIARDGETISPKCGERWIVLSGTVVVASQQGGQCRAYGKATLNVQASQSGGECWAHGLATLNVLASQQGGACCAYNDATLNVLASQQGGQCRAHGLATLNVLASQQGGTCMAYGEATLNVQASQQGGSCVAYDRATLNVLASQQGGACAAYGKATLNGRERLL